MSTREPALNLPAVVSWLAGFLILVHAGRWALGPPVDDWVVLTFSFIPARYGSAVDLLPGGEAAWFWSPATYSFLHADSVHLAVNLVWMASFGSAVARRFGAVRFLVLWLVTAIAGAAAHYLAHPGDEAIVLGASGAVSGITAAAARFAFADRGPLGRFGGTPQSYRAPALSLPETFRHRRAMSFILIWFGLNLLFGLAGGLMLGIDAEIAWQAHLGGFVAGLLGFAALDPVGRDPHDPGATIPLWHTQIRSAGSAGKPVSSRPDIE